MDVYGFSFTRCLRQQPSPVSTTSRRSLFKRLLIDSAAMVTASTIFVGWGLPLRYGIISYLLYCSFLVFIILFVITCHLWDNLVFIILFVITWHPQILQGRLENCKYMKLGKTDSCCADDQEKEYRATTNGVNIYRRWVANKACHIQHCRHELRIY